MGGMTLTKEVGLAVFFCTEQSPRRVAWLYSKVGSTTGLVDTTVRCRGAGDVACKRRVACQSEADFRGLVRTTLSSQTQRSCSCRWSTCCYSPKGIPTCLWAVFHLLLMVGDSGPQAGRL